MVSKEMKKVILLDILGKKTDNIVSLGNNKLGYKKEVYTDIFGNECYSRAYSLSDEEGKYYRFLDNCYVSSKNRNDINIVNIFESGLNDGKYVVQYDYKGLKGYELIDEYEDKEVLKIIFNSDSYVKKLTSKGMLSECNTYFKSLIEESISSENVVLFIDDYESEYARNINFIKEEVNKLNLEKYVEFNKMG